MQLIFHSNSLAYLLRYSQLVGRKRRSNCSGNEIKTLQPTGTGWTMKKTKKYPLEKILSVMRRFLEYAAYKMQVLINSCLHVTL